MNRGTVSGVVPTPPAVDASALWSQWEPGVNKLLAASYDPALAAVVTSLTDGQPMLTRLQVARAVTVTNIHMWLTQLMGGSPTVGVVGLYNASGVLLGQSASITSLLTATLGFKTFPLISPVPVIAGSYWVASLTNESGAQPAVAARTSPTAVGLIDANLSAADGFRGSLLTSAGSLPASFVPASATTSNDGAGRRWVALS